MAAGDDGGGVSGASGASGASGPGGSDAGSRRLTLREVRAAVAEGRRVPMLTCYDATTAKWLAAGGVRMLLVGDSAAQVILGHDSSIMASMDFLVTITAAVRRGAPSAMVVADMPFLSYQADDAEAIRNAGRFMTEGGADVVKLEVDRSFRKLVGRLARAGVPVMAHIGWRPQRRSIEGIRTAKVAGRGDAQLWGLVEDAQALVEAGAVMLLIEQCTAEAARAVVEAVDVPVIGCGAGPACHGHVVVLQDLVGMSDHSPSFVRPVASLGPALRDAARAWAEQVESGSYLRDDHPYR